MKPAWWTILTRELRDLWIGGKALHLIFLYTILLGLYSFFLASNAEVNLLPIKEMIQEVVKTGIVVCLLISMIIAADGITGERERGTLEGLLLTPASRIHLVLGKYLAAISIIPVALVITLPYLTVLSKGDPVLGPATFWLFVLGGLLVPALAAMGMLASIWCNSTKISMAVTFMLFLLMLLPSEIIRPGKVMTAGELRKALVFQSINPIDAITKFLGSVLVFDLPPGEHWLLLSTPVVIGAVVLVLLFAWAGPRLRLESTAGRKLSALWPARVPRTAPRAAAREREADRPRTASVSTTPPPTRTVVRPAAAQFQATSPTRAWWLIFRSELRDLWVGGKALNFTIAYTVLLAGYSYWQVQDSAVSLIPPKEMVFELMKVAMMGAVFMGLIIGADMLSGERERSTMEGLLVTPASRRQIVLGKFLAAASTWPVALIATVPYAFVLSQGDEVFGQAIRWAAIIGTGLAPAFTALGMLVSFWSTSNKSSMFVSLSLYLIFLLPTQLQGRAQGGFMGLLFQALNPMTGTRHFLAGILVNNRTVAEYSEFLVSTVVLLAVTCVLLFWYAAPALHLEAGRPFRRARSGLAAAGLIVALLGVANPSAARAASLVQSQAASAPPTAVSIPMQISIDKADTVLRAGLPLQFQTGVRNTSAEVSRPVIVAMNIINLDKQGEVVDPEDWSPQRTQYVEPLPPGQSATLDWRVNAILDGDFMVYMVAIPAPGSPEATSQPVASSGIHLTVTPYTKLNPGGVLPYALGGPVVLGLLIMLVYRYRRRQIDEGGSK